MILDRLQDRAQQEFQIECRIVECQHADLDKDLDLLSSTERERFFSFGIEKRKQEFLKGRIALNEAREDLNDEFSSAIEFPNPQYSISHSKGIAFCVGTKRSDQLGIGLDVEFQKDLKSEVARLMMSDSEQKEAARSGIRFSGRDLLQIWCVKESIFKSDPDNSSRVLANYQLNYPLGCSGESFDLPRKRRYKFILEQNETKVMSLGICEDLKND